MLNECVNYSFSAKHSWTRSLQALSPHLDLLGLADGHPLVDCIQVPDSQELIDLVLDFRQLLEKESLGQLAVRRMHLILSYLDRGLLSVREHPIEPRYCHDLGLDLSHLLLLLYFLFVF